MCPKTRSIGFTPVTTTRFRSTRPFDTRANHAFTRENRCYCYLSVVFYLCSGCDSGLAFILNSARGVDFFPMATTLKQWEEAWSRLIETREKLRSLEHNSAIVRHILILDNIKPGETISLDYAFGEQVPPVEVRKALENFNKQFARALSQCRSPVPRVVSKVGTRWANRLRHIRGPSETPGSRFLARPTS
jgi:hypothetical protein